MRERKWKVGEGAPKVIIISFSLKTHSISVIIPNNLKEIKDIWDPHVTDSCLLLSLSVLGIRKYDYAKGKYKVISPRIRKRQHVKALSLPHLNNIIK